MIRGQTRRWTTFTAAPPPPGALWNLERTGACRLTSILAGLKYRHRLQVISRLCRALQSIERINGSPCHHSATSSGA